MRYVKYSLLKWFIWQRSFFLLAFGAEQFPKIPLWLKHKEDGIKGKKERLEREKKKWNDGSQLLQIVFNLKTIQERSWYLFQSQAWVLWGVLSALSESNLKPQGHSGRKGKGVSCKMPENLCCLVFLRSFSFSLKHNHLKYTTLFYFINLPV